MFADMLEQIHIILSHTSHPGNIGAAARALKTMGVKNLTLIRPKIYPSAEATARASGADDVLANARVVDNLDEAIADCRLVLGTSARLRRVPLEQIDARQAGLRAIETAASGPVGILFGREQSGLSNDEMDRCHALVHIPTNPEYGSMNLGSTVQVMTYELRMAAVAAGHVQVPSMEEHLPASQNQLDGLFEHMESTLLDIRFLDPKQSVTMMSRLKRLFLRANPSETEIHILRGILSAAEKAGKN
jgi:TrmH family RNA methyltransferase